MRPTSDQRERTISRLKEAYAIGSLGQDTLERRVEATLRTVARDDLAAVSRDLPGMPRPIVGLAAALLATLVHDAPLRNPAALERVVLPSSSACAVVVGRHGSCGVCVPDPTVSRRHLSVRRDGGRWHARDLGSTNGVWLNGRRFIQGEVRPGDLLRLGSAYFLLNFEPPSPQVRETIASGRA